MSGWVAGAIVVGGALAYVGTTQAADTAAAATQNATNTAVGEQYAALAQQKALAAPYTAQGGKGIQTYNALTSANPQQVQSTLNATPGYQATYGQAVEAAARTAGASGENLTGNQLSAVESQGALLGDSTYQQAINNALTQEQIGQASAAGTAANIGSTATNVAGETIAQGTNLANISTNEIAGLTRAASGTTNQLLTYNTLQGLNQTPGSNPSYSPGGINTTDAGVTGIGQPTYAAPIST